MSHIHRVPAAWRDAEAIATALRAMGATVRGASRIVALDGTSVDVELAGAFDHGGALGFARGPMAEEYTAYADWDYFPRGEAPTLQAFGVEYAVAVATTHMAQAGLQNIRRSVAHDGKVVLMAD